MSTIISIPVDYDAIIQDALQILNTPMPSGIYSLDALTFEDYSRDAQFRMLYEMLVCVHGRDMIMRTEPIVGPLKATIVGADRNQTPWQCRIEFEDAEQAMLFKLTYGDEQL